MHVPKTLAWVVLDAAIGFILNSAYFTVKSLIKSPTREMLEETKTITIIDLDEFKEAMQQGHVAAKTCGYLKERS